MSLDHRHKIELALHVEATIAVSGVLTKQAVGADHRRLALELTLDFVLRPGIVVDHQ